ncbi:hypothetical protein AnigIFM60653_001708 [Aspergillus niger]|nr:hypothetical protein AnigIFM60653_001708 [Aspergillus niger]GLA17490.1 hypothetical protein AnigIFM62618_004630 [Aspergillus niger]
MIRAYKLHVALVAILLAQYMADTTSDSSRPLHPLAQPYPREGVYHVPQIHQKGPPTENTPRTVIRPFTTLSTISTSSSSSSSPTATTTYFIILRPRNTTPDDPLFNNLGASILDVNATSNQNTAIFNCQSSKLGNCRITVPVSATNGPSTAELTLTSVGSVTPLTDPTRSTTSLVIEYAIYTYIIRCEIRAPSNASCTTTDYAWESSDTFTFSYTSTSSSVPMTVTDPTSTATERTGPTGSPHPEQHFKNPLAWIAAPVVFLFVAGALVAGVVFWRKRKVVAKGSAGQPGSSDRTENTASRVFERAELPLRITALWRPQGMRRSGSSC